MPKNHLEIIGRFGITGATGTLGRLFIELGHTLSLDISRFCGDICNYEEVSDWISKGNFDYLIHFAAIVPTGAVEKMPHRAFAVNVGGVINLLNALSELNQRPWFFYASTSHVYRSQYRPISESDAVNPITLYGLTKYMGEQVLEKCAHELCLPYCIGRIFSFYHPSQAESFLYPVLLKRFCEDNLDYPFILKGADDVRDLSPAEEVVQKIYQLCQIQANGIINIGSGKGVLIRDFVQSIAPKYLNIQNGSEIPPTTLIADISRLKSLLSNNA